MASKSNPFIFGEIVEGEAFCDRELEHKSLVRDLRDAQKIFLISPRRYGKTSLIKRVFSTLRSAGTLCVYIDLYRAPSLKRFIDIYSSAIACSAETTLEKALRTVSELIPRLRPKISVDPEGVPTLTVESTLAPKETLTALEEVLDLPMVFARKKNKRIVVAFDEFQEITNFNGESIEKIFRSVIEKQHGAGYLFAGSKRHILEDMIKRKERAFYKAGKPLYLGEIPSAQFIPYLQERFKRGNIIPEKGVLEHVLATGTYVPYNVQFMCHELWDYFQEVGRIRMDDVGFVMSKIVDEQTPFFVSSWDNLPLNQRGLLKTVALYGGVNVFSQEFVRLSGLGSVSTLQTALKMLIKKGILEKQRESYIFQDVFFKEWIRRKI